jgi:16S rRNA (guanine527-N7)-methyltransferase
MPEPGDEFRTHLAPILKQVDLRLSETELALLTSHYKLLLQWNRRINLTSIREPKAIVTRHFGESLFVATLLGPETQSLLDVGTGAGFPGLPLAVCKPGWRVTLLESNAKKVAFLKEVARGIPNVSILHNRLENISGQFSGATVRGVRPASVLPELRRLSARVILLLLESQIAEVQEFPGYHWEKRVSLPWDPSRVVLIGFSVPRGTSST